MLRRLRINAIDNDKVRLKFFVYLNLGLTGEM